MTDSLDIEINGEGKVKHYYQDSSLSKWVNNTVEIVGGENLKRIKKFYFGPVKLEVVET